MTTIAIVFLPFRSPFFPALHLLCMFCMYRSLSFSVPLTLFFLVLCVCVCVDEHTLALSGLSLSAIGSDKEGDGEDMLSDCDNRPSPDSEPR